MLSSDKFTFLTTEVYLKSVQGSDEYMCLNEDNFKEVISAILEGLTLVRYQCHDSTYIDKAI
jgi:hypothetical protein